ERLDHAHERLRRQILGVVLVADVRREVGVDPVDVQAVERVDGVLVARLRTRDEPPQIGGRRSRQTAASHCQSSPPPAWLSDSLKHKTRRLQEAAALRAEQLAELVLDERVERARQAAVGAGVVLEEEQVRPPELDAIGERCAALLDEAAKLSEVPGAGGRNGWRLGSRLRLGLGL